MACLWQDCLCIFQIFLLTVTPILVHAVAYLWLLAATCVCIKTPSPGLGKGRQSLHFSFIFLLRVSNILLDRLTNNLIPCAVKFVLLVCKLSFILVLGFCVLLGSPTASSQWLFLPLLVDVCHASVVTLGSQPHSQICSRMSQSDSLPSGHTSMLYYVFAFPTGCELVSQTSQRSEERRVGKEC